MNQGCSWFNGLSGYMLISAKHSVDAHGWSTCVIRWHAMCWNLWSLL